MKTKILAAFSSACLCLYSFNSLADVEKGLSNKLSAAAYYNDSPESWLNGGLGRFSTGDQDADGNAAIVGQWDIGYKARFWSRFEFSTHLQLRDSHYSDERDSAGIVEAKLRYIQPIDDAQRMLFTAGQFFLPTSMENTDNFWDSPYTITWSSLNSWLGEEFRPIGLDADYSFRFENKTKLSLAATAFKGNDSGGALISWRGFSYGNNLVYLNETVPLPDITSLEDGGMYDKQQDEGTKPFAEDLDGNWGYALRAALGAPGHYQLKLTAIDNKGDGELYQGEYAWRTQFTILGASYNVSENWIVLGEVSQGSTTMGPPAGAVDIDFTSGYVLTSYLHNNWRYSLRLDHFETEDKNPARNTGVNGPQDINDDKGESVTLAVFWEPAGSNFSIGVEALAIDQTRQRLINPIQAEFNSMVDDGARPLLYEDSNTYQLALEANYMF